jgi:hypothetical protein
MNRSLPDSASEPGLCRNMAKTKGMKYGGQDVGPTGLTPEQERSRKMCTFSVLPKAWHAFCGRCLMSSGRQDL